VNPDEAREAFRLSCENPELAYEILTLGVVKVREWLKGFEEAVTERDFLKLFPLFPLEKKEAEIYLQILALKTGREEKVNPQHLLALNKALEQVQMQASPRLVVEGLALKLFA